MPSSAHLTRKCANRHRNPKGWGRSGRLHGRVREVGLLAWDLHAVTVALEAFQAESRGRRSRQRRRGLPRASSKSGSTYSAGSDQGIGITFAHAISGFSAAEEGFAWTL
jgi:hypothetical protein